MFEKLEQHSLFKEEAFNAAKPRTIREWKQRMTILQEELRLGNWDFERLRPSQHVYEARVKKWRGVKQFRYPANKFEAIEARAVMRFLKEWFSRSENLASEIDECARNIVKLSE